MMMIREKYYGIGEKRGGKEWKGEKKKWMKESKCEKIIIRWLQVEQENCSLQQHEDHTRHHDDQDNSTDGKTPETRKSSGWEDTTGRTSWSNTAGEPSQVHYYYPPNITSSCMSGKKVQTVRNIRMIIIKKYTPDCESSTWLSRKKLCTLCIPTRIVSEVGKKQLSEGERNRNNGV